MTLMNINTFLPNFCLTVLTENIQAMPMLVSNVIENIK